MSNAKIQQALGNLFDKQRIVFWYDTRREFRADFETLDLPGVEKIELANNEFGVKYRVLREQPEQKFLLFKYGVCHRRDLPSVLVIKSCYNIRSFLCGLDWFSFFKLTDYSVV